jgi:F-type H+-transporting ATPase subunit gamma
MIDEFKSKKVKVRLRAVGKKGIEFFNFQGIEILESYRGVSSAPTYEKAQEVIKVAIDDFVAGVTDKVILVHNGYKNMISQELRVNTIVPVEPPVIEDNQLHSSLMDFEPEHDERILDELMRKYFEYSMYYALIDSLAAEHSARMQAMDNATNNAKARVKELNLAYNKARQESITTELIEIISGVESMK